MGYQSAQTRRIWELVAQQHGVVSREQLIGLGVSGQGIKRRRASGRLHQVMRGVYAAGRPELSREGCWMAVVLACGPSAVLSHASAAALWRIGGQRDGVIEVSVVARRERLAGPGSACTAARDSNRRIGRPWTAITSRA